MLGDVKINGKQFKWTDYLLSSLPFILVIGFYCYKAWLRHQANPLDKILPYPNQMVEAMTEFMAIDDIRAYIHGEITFEELQPKLVFAFDTLSSLARIACGLTLSTIVGLVLGLHLGYFRTFRVIFLPFVTVCSIIPPTALLPILLIAFGVGEEAKVILIFIGTVFTITTDVYLGTIAIHANQVVSAQTLGSSKWSTVYQALLPQIMPQLVDSVRKCLGAAWIFLITSEMVAATEGLGYQIGIQRRYSAMDIIIPYVMWIALLGYLADVVLRRLSARRYPWYHKQK